MQAARDFIGGASVEDWCFAIKMPASKIKDIVQALEDQDVDDADALLACDQEDILRALGSLATCAVKGKLAAGIKALKFSKGVA